jgi:type II secretory pathway component PulJ
MNRRRSAPRRPGFSLIEICVVLAALALALSMLAVALGGALRLERASSAALERLGAHRDLANQFRADVAQAAEAPQRWHDTEAGPTCLILRMGKDRHVVYRWDGDRLARFDHSGDEAHRRDFGLGGGPAAVEFDRSRVGGRLLTLRVFAVARDGGRVPAAEITAALGGDLQ